MEEGNYEDMLYLPHHQSETRPHMSMLNRAAQFSPFAALVGYDDAVAEAARLTDEKRELSESEADALDDALSRLMERLEKTRPNGKKPSASIFYFAPDGYKTGGAYKNVHAVVKRVDLAERLLLLTD